MVEVELKEWGNSIGVVLPIDKIREMGLKKGDKIDINIILKQRVDGFGVTKGAKSFEEDKPEHEEILVIRYIIDSYAWIEYFNGSKKGEILKNLFKEEENKFYTVSCCLSEIIGWAIKNKQDFENLYRIIKSNSDILNLSENDWIIAGKERIKQREKQKDFGLIDSTLLVKQTELNCKIITGDLYFKELKNIVFL